MKTGVWGCRNAGESQATSEETDSTAEQCALHQSGGDERQCNCDVTGIGRNQPLSNRLVHQRLIGSHEVMRSSLCAINTDLLRKLHTNIASVCAVDFVEVQIEK